MNTIVVILAAGRGTRMHSLMPKALHPLLGLPMIHYALNTTAQINQDKPIVVVGHQAELVLQVVGESAIPVFQEMQLGMAQALSLVMPIVNDKVDQVLVLPVDMPLVKPETFDRLAQAQVDNPGPVTVLSLKTEHLLNNLTISTQARNSDTDVAPENLWSQELDTGICCFDAEWLRGVFTRVPSSLEGEFTLRKLLKTVLADGYSIKSLMLEDPDEVIDINNRVQLSEAESVLRRRVNEKWMLAGVTMISPETIYIEASVTIGQDSVIWPNTYLHGNTTIGERCEIGPNSIMHSAKIGDDCKVLASVLEEAILEEHVVIGPFARLRRGAHLARGVHMGNFGEVKNSYLGPGVKMGHFSYIGDATIDERVNIGAGTITCNLGMDGKKSKTRIGKGAFIGSDTMLVAPVEIGEGSATGSGSVVTKDIPPFSLAVGVPARVIRKLKQGD